MKGVMFTPLKRISNEKGDVLHALKVSESSYKGFGEAYFSLIKPKQVKGWKKHTQMTLNLIVPHGAVRFVMFDDREDSDSYGKLQQVDITPDNYGRLTVSPGIWVAFQGIAEKESLLLNLADIEHDPTEAINKGLEEIVYQWNAV